jgi:serine/threonine protein phosphatase 1
LKARPNSSPMLSYAIGDIHGSLAKLRKLMAKCRKHADGRSMKFVFLGDYIDRGPQSRGVIRTLIELQSKPDEQIIALKGNHEAVALAVIDGTLPAEDWLNEGGVATLRSYGVDNARELPADHVRWLRSLPLSYDDGRRFFVHAGIDPEKPFDKQDAFDLIWIREPFLSDNRDYGRLVVHGHTPVDNGVPELQPNRLNLDTGAVYGGPLSAAVFDAVQINPIAFLQAE